MSLKSDYIDGPTGFTQKMADVAAAGVQWVQDNRATISEKLEVNAARGLKKFTVTVLVSFEPNNLRLRGLHWETFRSGIMKEMLEESIYVYEVDPQLNTTDNAETKIDLVFDFTGSLK